LCVELAELTPINPSERLLPNHLLAGAQLSLAGAGWFNLFNGLK